MPAIDREKNYLWERLQPRMSGLLSSRLKPLPQFSTQQLSRITGMTRSCTD